MREFGISITEALQQGLPPDKRAEARGDFVSELVNIRPTTFGGEGISHLNMPAGLYSRLDWPFPQVFHGRRHTFVCTRDNVYYTIPGFEDHLDNTQPLDTVKWDTGVSESIPEGGRWDFVDMGDAFYFYNGECVVFSLYEEFSEQNTRVWINKDLPIGTGARFNGRVVFGNLGPGIFDHFNELVNEIAETEDDLTEGTNSNSQLREPPFEVDADDFRENTVMWSSIGGGDFPAWLFFPKGFLKQRGSVTVGPSWDKVRRRFKRNQLGWMHMPQRGGVIAIEPLGQQAAIVYGENYVTALLPTSGGGDIPATFGKRVLSSVGIKAKAAVATAQGQQVFIGDDNRIRVINTDLQIQTIGYNQFTEDLEKPVITYEPREEEFFISDAYSGRAFALSIDGPFYEHGRPVSSIETINAETKAVVHDTRNSGAVLATSFIDFGQTGRKTITQVDVDYRGQYQPYIDVAFRHEPSQPMQTLGWEEAGPDGSLPIRVDGREFQVRVYFPSHEGIEIDDVQIRFQLPDNRFRRGTSANPVGA